MNSMSVEFKVILKGFELEGHMTIKTEGKSIEWDDQSSGKIIIANKNNLN